MSFQFDSVRLKKRIAEVLEKTYNQADPKLLSQYRAIFKQEVSFFRRSYFTAYLLMELDRGGDGKFSGFRERNPRKFQKTVQERDEGNRQESRKVLLEEESVRLFVGIGRGRRVFPREILGLIASKTAVPKDDIGAIRIFDNYSFVQVRAAAADEIIEALNGKPFRGRSLVVNYARNRKDEAKPAEEEGAEGPGFSAEADGSGDTDSFPENRGDGYMEAEDAGYREEEPDGGRDESSIQEDDDHSDKKGV
ncbi:MAG: DbpA RNA binding domain-containing protein [Treponema sp.]|jgi:hypothetical protein|nr:DbpA RNA binding domain-containing protein [Treponema sp.]